MSAPACRARRVGTAAGPVAMVAGPVATAAGRTGSRAQRIDTLPRRIVTFREPRAPFFVACSTRVEDGRLPTQGGARGRLGRGR